MILNRIAKQKMDVLKVKQPDLYKSLLIHFPENVKSLTIDELRGLIGGFALEVLIQSGGSITTFEGGFEEPEEEEFLID